MMWIPAVSIYTQKKMKIFLFYGDMTVSKKSCENLLSANDKTLKNIIFAGSFNINILDYESNNKVEHFLSRMFQYNMIPTMNKVTRVIDHIITNTIILVFNTGLV